MVGRGTYGPHHKVKCIVHLFMPPRLVTCEQKVIESSDDVQVSITSVSANRPYHIKAKRSISEGRPHNNDL